MKPASLAGKSCFVAIVFLAFVVPLGAKNVRKLTLRDLDANKVRVGDRQGQIVVLNFWATWCGPCKQELPRLSEMAQRYTGRNVAFILASIDEPKKLAAVRDYVAQQKVTLPVLVGASVDLLEEVSGTNIVPATLIINENGEIIRVVNGEAREEDVREVLDWLLDGRKGPAPSARVKRY